jgi:two-component system, chemotaxis family, CheB/CheR fusion protein
VVVDREFEDLLQFLRESRGFDFTGYKRPSLMRRVRRRMAAVDIATFEQYLDYLQLHQEEFQALFDTILINVTGFFRDADAWVHLREVVVPDLLARRAGLGIRAWSAGCASGEEAYSLAIILSEAMGPDVFREQAKIYATDVDEEALAHARQAAYTEREMRGLSDEQIERYFERQGTRHVFRKDLRRAVIFGRNDLVQDAPISRIDLLICRNTLMYFNAEAQSQILTRLNFALSPGGVLFLGKAEMLLGHQGLFTPLDLRRRFFRKAQLEARGERPILPEPRGDGLDPIEYGLLGQQALFNSQTAQLVVDARGKLVFANRGAEAMFALGERDRGRAFNDLESSYRPLELRPLIAQASAERLAVWAHDVSWERTAGETVVLDVQIAPLLDGDGGVLGVSITFQDVTRYRRLQDDLESANRQLEAAYEELQSANEELETTNEELQSTVEELETTNEELQSTNEELETMNEELQSMNDELQSSNDELSDRTSEVSDLNRFMQSILASLRAAVVVVDREMRVLVWNSQAQEMWGLRTEEAVGSHLLALDFGLPVEKLRPIVGGQAFESDGQGNKEVVLPAVNRRGRSIDVRVTGSQLRDNADGVAGIILVMEQVD